MRKLVIGVGAIVAGLLVALIVLRVVGLDPKDRRAGLWLTGEVVTTPVTDWSFTDKYRNIYVQTKTWYTALASSSPATRPGTGTSCALRACG